MSAFPNIISMALMLFSAVALNAQSRDFTFSNSAPKEGLSVKENTRSCLSMRHALKRMKIIHITDNGYSGEVLLGGTGIVLPANAGEPNLPNISRFVAIPNGATAHVEMNHYSMTTITNVDLLPAPPIKFDTDDSPNTYDRNLSIYNQNAFYPKQPISVSEPFSLRGVQTVAVTITPYQYNPITKELRVYDDLEFDIQFDGGNGEFGETRLRSPYWDPILMQNLVNYNQLPTVDYETRMQEWVTTRNEGCEYLIIIPNNNSFRQYANQLKEYRTKQGILTEVKSLNNIACTTTEQLKSYFHNAYNTWDIPPVAVLLFGDHNNDMSMGIPAEYTYHSSEQGYCITDNGYADVTGDNLPEMAFSRLVAANTSEAQMMVSKQLEYEYTNPNMNASSYDHPITALGWHTQRWFQICSETVGGYWRLQGKHPVRINAIYSGTPDDIWSSNVNTPIIVDYFGPTGIGYLPATPNELGGWDDGTASQVIQSVNNGCMLLQHRDHGNFQSWGEPDFHNEDITQMANIGKLTFVNTINCKTGAFDHDSDCLIEAFMRHTYNNLNAGAVGCIGPTLTSYSFVNDAYVWGLYDQYDPQFLPDYGPYANYEGNWRPAFGNVAGKYFLQQSSWPYNPGDKAITHKMFTAHCDAFLTLYTQVPTPMNVTHPTQITNNTTSINVTAPQGAIIALTQGHNIIAVATATGNSQNIVFTPQSPNTNITIVATKQDHIRYTGNITVISDSELVIADITLNDANNNGQLDYGEQSSFNIKIKNAGNLPSTQAVATLSTDNPMFVTINQNTANVPALPPNQTIIVEDIFRITVSNTIPNGTQLNFTIQITDSNHSWSHSFNLTANAPNLSIFNYCTINDQGNHNGRLDPGELATLTFTYENSGEATAYEVSATLNSISQPYITIYQPTIITPAVGTGETIEANYTIAVSSNMPKGETAQFTFCITSGSYTDEYSFTHRVGLDIANFENGMGELGWENDPFHPWTITNEEPYEGQYCLKSGNISNNGTSTLNIQFIVENELDEIRFHKKTNCGNNNYLKFYIDGNLMQQWGGNQNWSEVVFPVTHGEHTFNWIYEKNETGSGNQDKVWIDEILFPVRHIVFDCNAGNDQAICYQEHALLEGYAVGYETIQWTTSGDGQFSQPNSLTTIYIPGIQDINNKHVILTLTATNENGETTSDNLHITIYGPPNINLIENAEICASETMQLYASVTDADNIIWTTHGDGHFDNPNEPNTIYTPGPQDIIEGSVLLSLTANSSCGNDEKNLLLNIHPIQHHEFEISSCGPYTWNGVEYNETGVYEQSLTSIHGCDSTVVMHFTLVDSYHIDLEQETCGSYDWNGTIYTESGDYVQTFLSIHGCDSTVILHLSIIDSYYVELEENACDSYVWNGIPYVVSGDYEQAFVSNLGCDSIVTMHLNIYNNSMTEFSVEACVNYVWDGIEYTESGVYVNSYTNVHGCDSIVMMVLSIDNAPMLESIDGETDVDVRLTPSSEYTTTNSTGTYQWSLEPEDAGIITSERHQATVVWSEAYKGEAVIKVEAANNCGQDENSLSITVKNSTGIGEHRIGAIVYPNPTSDQITIDLEQDDNFIVNIFDSKGQLIFRKKNIRVFSFKDYPSGLYQVVLEQNGQHWKKKIIKM